MKANNNKTIRPSISKSFIIFCLSLLVTSAVCANPQGGNVTAGSATITQAPNSTVIQQNSESAIIEWQSFNIGAKDSTHFQQPTNGITLNRIDAQQGMTQIYGQLSATGRIILVNPAGIYFGIGSVIHVGGIIASTANISNANFLAGKYIFDQPSPFGAGIVNEGSIKAADYGLVALIGTSVTNRGMIEAELGSIVLATGDKFTLDFYGDQLINFSIDARASTNGRIVNTGSLIADGGKILVTAQAAQGVLDNVIDMQGVAQARSVAQHDGQIILSAGTGEIVVGGKVSVAGKKGQAGGNIQITANKIKVTPHAVITANGDAGGGTIALNANKAIVNGTITAIGSAANAIGGNITVAANNISLLYNGVLNASGNAGGGTVTLSGKTNSSSPAQTVAAYIGVDYLSNVIADSMQTGSAGNIDINGALVSIAGNISAQGLGAKSVGGSVVVAANTFITQGALLNVSGNAGGGSVTVVAQSKPASTQPAYINIDSRSVVLANAMDSGNAGNITFSADDVNVAGNVSAQGMSADSLGGNIKVAANSFIAAGAVMNVSSGAGGGSIVVAAPIAATNSYANIDSRSVILADAIDTGTAGEIKFAADNVTIAGLVSAQGLSPTTLGGTIQVAANAFTAAGANMNVSSGAGGGTIVVAAPNTTNSYINIDSRSVLLANAIDTGTAGAIYLNADAVTLAGKISAQGIGSSTMGGEIEVAANSFITQGAMMNVSAHTNAGVVTVAGANAQSPNASYIGVDGMTTIIANAIGNDGNGGKISLYGEDVTVAGTLSANSVNNGNGGDIVVWANNAANFSGRIIARGGAASGNGGQAEVSGKKALAYVGNADLRASHGTTGTITLDPQNITIQTLGSNTPNSSNSVLTVATLETMLDTANVLVITATTGNQAGDITVANNVAWNNANKLTLSAYRNVNINASITNHAGGSVAVVADNTVDGVGTINFSNQGSITLSGGGNVTMVYEPQNNNFRYPNNYSSYVHVSNGSSVSYEPLNLVTTQNNDAIISSMNVLPNVMESLSLALGQEPLEVIVPQGDGTTLAFENNLETINEKSPSPVSVRLMDQPAGSGCGESATCVSSDFVIE